MKDQAVETPESLYNDGTGTEVCKTFKSISNDEDDDSDDDDLEVNLVSGLYQRFRFSVCDADDDEDDNTDNKFHKNMNSIKNNNNNNLNNKYNSNKKRRRIEGKVSDQ